jgi:hypothetical protein
MPELDILIGDSFLPLLHEHTDKRFILIEGPRGTAKTRSILTCLMLYALANDGARIILARSTRTRLSQSVLTTLEEQVYPLFGLSLDSNASRDHRSAYVLPNRSTFIPMGLDDPARTQSVECAKIYVAEGVEIASQDEVLALAGALRQRGMPEQQCIVDCNPGPPSHWLNDIAEPVPKMLRRVNSRADYYRILAHNDAPPVAGKWKRIITRHQDNPGYWDHDAWDWTPDGKHYLTTLGELKGHLRRRWLDGDWVAAEGAVYPEFDEDKHVIDPFPIPRTWPCVMAKDPGRDHPDATVVAAIAPTGELYICAESVVRNTTNADDAKVLNDLCRTFNVVSKLGDPHMMFSSTKFSETGKTIAQQFLEYGHTFRPAPMARNQEEMAQQVEMVRTLLCRMDSKGEPMLRVFRSCPNVIRGFQTWGYVRNVKGEMKGGPDRFEDIGDDEMDAVRMIVSSGPTFEGPRFSVSVG